MGLQLRQLATTKGMHPMPDESGQAEMPKRKVDVGNKLMS